MRISNENIKGLNSEELIKFVAAHRYNSDNTGLTESLDFHLLPVYIKHLIHILDFETEYEMQGLLTMLQNNIVQYLPQITESFNQTDNPQIAYLLTHIAHLLAKHGISVQDLQTKTEGIQEFNVFRADMIAKNEQLMIEICQIDERLQTLIEEKAYWKNIEKIIKRHC